MPGLRNARGLPLRHYDIYPLLGLRSGHHLPKEGLGARYVDGMVVFVKPKTENRRAHRVMVICPDCGNNIPFGRLQQHQVVHKPPRSAAPEPGRSAAQAFVDAFNSSKT